MTKLSRKDKYRDLRESIELEAEQTSAQVKPGRLSRMAAPDLRFEQRKEAPASEPGLAENPVLEDLLGEVKQYNMDNGDLVTEDTQLQILHDLSYGPQGDARRSDYIETMEQNEDAGGTTRNLYGSDLSAIMSAASKSSPQPAHSAAASSAAAQSNTNAKKPGSSQSRLDDTDEFSPHADETVEPDYLDLFTPQKQSAQERVSVIEEVPSAKSRRKERKPERKKVRPQSALTKETAAQSQNLDDLFETAQIPVEASSPKASFTNTATPSVSATSSMQEEDEYFGTKKSSRKAKSTSKNEPQEQKPAASKAATAIMLVCCVVLVILIVLTVIWMSQLGLLS